MRPSGDMRHVYGSAGSVIVLVTCPDATSTDESVIAKTRVAYSVRLLEELPRERFIVSTWDFRPEIEARSRSANAERIAGSVRNGWVVLMLARSPSTSRHGSA